MYVDFDQLEVIDLTSDEEGHGRGTFSRLKVGRDEVEVVEQIQGNSNDRHSSLDVAAQLGPRGLDQDWNLHSNHFVQPRPQPRPFDLTSNRPMDVQADIPEGESLTIAACLQIVTNIIPDVSTDHVLSLITAQTQDNTRTVQVCEQLVSQLLDDASYPKEDEDASRKRKRSISKFEDEHGELLSGNDKIDAVNLLKDEFTSVPARHIASIVKQHKTVYKSYQVIEEQLRNYSEATPFTKVARPRSQRGAKPSLVVRGSRLPEELQAAREECERAALKRHKAEEASLEEENNTREAILAGTMTDCQCCFGDLPLNRMVGCGGPTVHLFCPECVKRYVESEIGSSRCRPVCFADPNCGATFTRRQLQDCLCEATFERLEHMQQMQDLEMAGLDLDECPFCDFKQECPPVEEDKEFRCLNPKCLETSCRLCQKKTHIPMSCEEAKRDEKITIRHTVEEAMTSALIRNCNKCKRPFVKEHGCNKMSCSNCGNIQCYVCSKDIKDYSHFEDSNATGKGCPLHDNVEKRHDEEVKKAAAEAVANARAENPNLSDTDLRINVSESVQKAEKERTGRVEAAHERFPFHMREGILRNGRYPAEIGIPAPVAPAVPVAPVAPVPPVAPAARAAPPWARQMVHFQGIHGHAPRAAAPIAMPMPAPAAAPPPQQLYVPRQPYPPLQQQQQAYHGNIVFQQQQQQFFAQPPYHFAFPQPPQRNFVGPVHPRYPNGQLNPQAVVGPPMRLRAPQPRQQYVAHPFPPQHNMHFAQQQAPNQNQ